MGIFSIEGFEDRGHAGRLLAAELAGMPLTRPLVLAIPRGGIDVGVEIARSLNAELDVVLARKLRCPFQPELALGAISETGELTLDPRSAPLIAGNREAVEAERQHQLAEITRRRQLYRRVRPQAEIAGRSVILTDDGIATGSTMIAAIHSVRAAEPRELIVAVPVGAPDRVAEITHLCDRMICLHAADEFRAVSQFYRVFDQVSDERVVEVLEVAAGRQSTSADMSATP